MTHLFIKHGCTERVTHFWSNGSDGAVRPRWALPGINRARRFSRARGNDENITIRARIIAGIMRVPVERVFRVVPRTFDKPHGEWIDRQR